MAPVHLYSNWNSRDTNELEQIDIVYLEKTGEDENLSNPKKLIEFADLQKTNGAIKYDIKFDKMIVIFDGDVFENQLNNYENVIALGLKKIS